MTYCHTDISHFEIQQFQQISGCLAERSKAPDSRKNLDRSELWEYSGIVRCKSSNLLATIIYYLFGSVIKLPAFEAD